MSAPDLGRTMGAVFVGLFVDTMLYGILLFQTYQYCTSGARDRLGLRALIATLWALDTLQLVLLCHATYHFLILNYGRPETLQVSVWSLDLEIAPSVIVTFLVRCFFTVRLWHREHRALASMRARTHNGPSTRAVSHGNKPLIALIMVFSLPQLGTPPALTRTRFHSLPFRAAWLTIAPLKASGSGPMTAQMATAAVADALITGPLLYYLDRGKTGIRRTNSLINRLIVWTVNTALLTGVVEVAQLVAWVTARKTLVFLPFHLVLAKLYTNSMLAMLNGRRGLRRAYDGSPRTSRFASPATDVALSLHESGAPSASVLSDGRDELGGDDGGAGAYPLDARGASGESKVHMVP
ncbi:hypothetical protein BC834DRAFT_965742 [Gloeopeniophorella convolvens]|nr:hypothetical protein BC834DRAFT_965742 [Gloeopeniophorella convolvens]